MSTYQQIAQRRAQVPVRQLCRVLHVAPAVYYAWYRRRQQPTAEPVWQVAVRESFAYHSQRYGTRRLRAEVQAQGHARLYPAPPTWTRPGGPRPTARWASRPPRPRIRPRWATSRICPARAGPGFTQPPGSTAARARAGAGTCASTCPKTWSARPCDGPWPRVGLRPGSSCTPTRAASTGPPGLNTYSLGTGLCCAEHEPTRQLLR